MSKTRAPEQLPDWLSYDGGQNTGIHGGRTNFKGVAPFRARHRQRIFRKGTLS